MIVEEGKEGITGGKPSGSREGMGPSAQMQEQAGDGSSESREGTHEHRAGGGGHIHFPDPKQGSELAVWEVLGTGPVIPPLRVPATPKSTPLWAATQPLCACFLL